MLPTPRPEGAQPLVSVIVPARDAEATIGACLDALAAQGVPGTGGELIVVDDRSRDATARIAARPGVRLLRGDGRGPAAARNLAAREARGDLLLFVDADAAPEEGWLREMSAPFADPAVVAVKGRYHTVQRGLVPRFAQLEFEDKYARLERARRVDFVDSGTAAYRRDAFLALGGFDESFPLPSVEDVELGFRLAATGARLVYSPRAAVVHRHAARLRDYLAKKARYGYFRVRVYRRHPSKALGDSYTPPTMALQIGLAGCAAVAAALAVARVPRARRASLLSLCVFGVTTVPLIRRAVRSDPALAPLVPVLVLARSLAQGVGIGFGLLAQAVDRSPQRAARALTTKRST